MNTLLTFARVLKIQSFSLRITRSIRGESFNHPRIPRFSDLDAEDDPEMEMDEDVSRSLHNIEARFNQFSQRNGSREPGITSAKLRKRIAERDRAFLKRKIIETKIQKELEPPEENLLTWEAKEQIKYLNKEYPKEWTAERLSESFPVSLRGVSLILRSRRKMYTQEQVMKHDLKVKENWDLLMKARGEQDGPLNPTLNMLMENKKFLTIGNAMGSCSLPLPMSVQLPKESDRREINLARLRKKPGQLESYFIKMSEPETKKVEKPVDVDNEHPALMKEGLKLLSNALMQETSRSQARNSYSKVVAKTPSFNLQDRKGSTSRSQVITNRGSQTENSVKRNSVGDLQTKDFQIDTLSDQTEITANERHESNKKQDSTMDFLKSCVSTEPLKTAYILHNDGKRMLDREKLSFHNQTATESNEHREKQLQDMSGGRAMKSEMYEESEQDHKVKIQGDDSVGREVRSRRHRKRLEKMRQTAGVCMEEDNYEKLQMYETGKLEDLEGKFGASFFNSPSDVRSSSDSGGKVGRLEQINGIPADTEDKYSDSHSTDEDYWNAKTPKKKFIKSEQQKEYEDNLAYEEVTIKDADKRLHRYRHAYSYDSKGTYHSPYGRLERETEGLTYKQKQWRGKYYQRDNTVYDSEGEIIFRIPGNLTGVNDK